VQASGKLEGLTSSFRKDFDTDSAGKYALPNLAAGSYRLTVRRPGFATQVVTLEVGSGVISRTITLALAAVASSIEVVAATPLPGTDAVLDKEIDTASVYRECRSLRSATTTPQSADGAGVSVPGNAP